MHRIYQPDWQKNYCNIESCLPQTIFRSYEPFSDHRSCGGYDTMYFDSTQDRYGQAAKYDYCCDPGLLFDVCQRLGCDPEYLKRGLCHRCSRNINVRSNLGIRNGLAAVVSDVPFTIDPLDSMRQRQVNPVNDWLIAWLGRKITKRLNKKKQKEYLYGKQWMKELNKFYEKTTEPIKIPRKLVNSVPCACYCNSNKQTPRHIDVSNYTVNTPKRNLLGNKDSKSDKTRTSTYVIDVNNTEEQDIDRVLNIALNVLQDERKKLHNLRLDKNACNQIHEYGTLRNQIKSTPLREWSCICNCSMPPTINDSMNSHNTSDLKKKYTIKKLVCNDQDIELPGSAEKTSPTFYYSNCKIKCGNAPYHWAQERCITCPCTSNTEGTNAIAKNTCNKSINMNLKRSYCKTEDINDAPNGKCPCRTNKNRNNSRKPITPQKKQSNFENAIKALNQIPFNKRIIMKTSMFGKEEIIKKNSVVSPKPTISMPVEGLDANSPIKFSPVNTKLVGRILIKQRMYDGDEYEMYGFDKSKKVLFDIS